MIIKKIISGGQTGVDRAALDAAIDNGIAHGGWCPSGRLAEDGVIDVRYLLRETDSREYSTRTRWNVRDSDGTMIINQGLLEGGTALTVQAAKSLNKPCLIIDVDQRFLDDLISNWITLNQIKVLNVAGPRESKRPGIYQISYALLDSYIKRSRSGDTREK